MAKNKNIRIPKEVDEFFDKLERLQKDRHDAYQEFVETIKNLQPIPRAEAWLRFVAQNSDTDGDYEAIVYLRSRGNDCSEEISELIDDWKQAEKRIINNFLIERKVINVDTGKTIKIEKLEKVENISDYPSSYVPDFWGGKYYQGETIDATMLRTVEWCNIGRFDQWWNRYAKEQKEIVFLNGVEDTLEASYYLFNMCRSKYAIDLMQEPFERLLAAIELPNRKFEFPWQMLDYEDPPKSIIHFGYAAMLAFLNRQIRPNNIKNELVSPALELLLRNQDDGGWWTISDKDKDPSIGTTAIVIHALELIKPRGWEFAVSSAKDWLLSIQDKAGCWIDPGYPDIVHLTVLVLDAIELAEGGSNITFHIVTEQTQTKNVNQPFPVYIENKGDIIMKGDKFTAGDNIGGIQNIGKFRKTFSTLNSGGKSELVDALKLLVDAINKSENISDEEKKEQLDIVEVIASEASKPKPNKTLIKMLGDGLIAGLKLIPDVAKAAVALMPLLTELSK